MHPINSNNFGATGIEVSYYNGTSVVNGYIVKQVGPSKFNVTDGSHPRTVMLAPTVAIATALGAANSAFCTILAVPVSTTSTGASFVVHYAATVATISAGGAGSAAGYAVNDVLTITSGGGATITVNTVDGGGGILTSTISAAGTVTVLPTNPVSVTGGAGTGAKFNMKYNVGTVTASGGTGYKVGQTLNFSNMTAVTMPTAHIATVTGGAVATVTVDTHGAGITVAATGVGANGAAEHVSHIYYNRVITAEGHYYPWSLVTSVDGSAVIQIF